MGSWQLIARLVGGIIAALGCASGAAAQQLMIEPPFSIWDVKLGTPVAELPDIDTSSIACGTNGGPPSTELKSFADFAGCPVEPSGLREIQFTYDDEQDYVARAMSFEYEFAQAGTSVYAHQVILSVLVDKGGIVRGLRIVTDNRVSDRDRRIQVTLARNFKARFTAWQLACEDLPPAAGEMPIGKVFEHELCTAERAEDQQRLRLESIYARRRGQEAVNLETQKANSGYFASATRLEIVEAPYEPDTTPAR
jgi:hypothetical protein